MKVMCTVVTLAHVKESRDLKKINIDWKKEVAFDLCKFSFWNLTKMANLSLISFCKPFTMNSHCHWMILHGQNDWFHVKIVISSARQTKNFFVLMTSHELHGRCRNLRNISRKITKLPNFWQHMWHTKKKHLKDDFGNTPKALALQNNHTEIAMLLWIWMWNKDPIWLYSFLHFYVKTFKKPLYLVE